MAAATQSTEALLDSSRNVRTAAALAHLDEFVREAWQYVEPDTPLRWNWHLDELCGMLTDVSAGKIRRVVMNVPPGTMKSLLVSVFWPAWEWASNPSLRYLTASYSDGLTVRDNRRVRSIVMSDWYRESFGVFLVSDQNEKIRFETHARGWRVASSVGGLATGEHPDRIIIDDPLSALQARSQASRLRVNTWIDQTLSTRGSSRGAAYVMIMQRLHEEDPTAHVLEKGGWHHVRFPMEFESELPPEHPDYDPTYPPDPRDRREAPGELLWPSLFSADVVRQLQIDLGLDGASGQLQQRPRPFGGGLFKREWFNYVEAIEVPRIGTPGVRACRGWDIGGSDEGDDWTVGVKIVQDERPEATYGFYVVDVDRFHEPPGDTQARMVKVARADGPQVMVREEREPGSSGIAVISARAKAMTGFDFAGVAVSTDKIVRSAPYRTQAQAGNVALVRASWNHEYLRELTDFPVGVHDDQVDASSCCFNAVALEERPKVRKGGTFGRGYRRY